MNQNEKLQLQKLIAANDSVDTTEEIRKLKHSIKIKDDVERLYRLKMQYYQLLRDDKTKFDEIGSYRPTINRVCQIQGQIKVCLCSIGPSHHQSS